MPAGWVSPTKARENGGDSSCQRPGLTREITVSQKRADLDELLKRHCRDIEADPQSLAVPEWEEQELASGDQPDANQKCLSIPEVGTLYNNLSIVVKIHVLGGTNPATMLFPGDLADWTYLLLERFPDLSADVFKYPHHGSAGPLIDRKALTRLRYLSPSYCPYFPSHQPERCWWHRMYLDRLERRIAGRDASRLLTEVVKPRHTLVHPYPSQGLPRRTTFLPSMGQIHANREHLNWDGLADPSNPAVRHVLGIGKGGDEIRILAAGATT